jgi:tRNA (guanosine-2'-O-)-methyltransferase
MDLRKLAYLESFLSARRLERFLEILSKRTRHITVALEDVYQMHNASAVIRSCDVFGMQEAHLIEARYGRRLDKKIAMGAQKWVDVSRYENTATCIEALRHRGYRIVATSPQAGNLRPGELPLDRPVALFFGTEKEGLSKEVLRQADAAVSIPMVGFTESLNISVAAAILLYDLSNRLRNSGVAWQLSEADILEKRFDWAFKSVQSAPEIMARYREGN